MVINNSIIYKYYLLYRDKLVKIDFFCHWLDYEFILFLIKISTVFLKILSMTGMLYFL